MNTPLDTTTFENWMRQIMERFDRNEQLIASLTSKELREVKYLDGGTAARQSGLMRVAQHEQTLHPALPQFGDTEIPDALAQGVLQGIGRAGVPENPFQRV